MLLNGPVDHRLLQAGCARCVSKSSYRQSTTAQYISRCCCSLDMQNSRPRGHNSQALVVAGSSAQSNKKTSKQETSSPWHTIHQARCASGHFDGITPEVEQPNRWHGKPKATNLNGSFGGSKLHSPFELGTPNITSPTAADETLSKDKTRMGVNFRSSTSNGSVWLGKRTVKEGESMGVWNLQGQYKVVDGPHRKWLWFSRFCFMDRHLADAHQYLIVQHRDGRTEHKRGPTALFEDPVRHESVRVEPAVTVDAFEVIVVYTEDTHGNVKRSIVHGPTVFVPAVNQWLHVFRWHGSQGGNQYSKVPGALVFTKLRTIPDQFYYDAGGVRTADDASLTIKVMVFFGLQDLEVMLNSTHDPIGDFINAMLADLMNFGSRHTYEELLASAQQLSDLASYPVLVQRASAIGFRVSKVVYRGYTAGSALQDLSDRAIRTRTEMRLKQEQEEQAQRSRDLDLRSSVARGNEEREEEAARQAHRLRMESAAAADALRRAEEAHRDRLRQESERAASEQATRDAAMEGQLRYVQALQGMGTDVTRYLVACAEACRPPDRVLKIMGSVPEGTVLQANV